MDKAIEIRNFPVEIRMVEEDGKKMLRGHAAVFNSKSSLLAGMFVEIIKPGAFRSALLVSDVRCLRDHNASMILGRQSSGTLNVNEDERGLAYACDMPGTSYANDLEISMSRGDVKECSFGFSVREGGDKWEEQEDGTYLRTILEDGIEKLFDVSPVTFPAYPDTSCAMRSLEKVQSENVPTVSDIYFRKLRLELEASR